MPMRRLLSSLVLIFSQTSLSQVTIEFPIERSDSGIELLTTVRLLSEVKAQNDALLVARGYRFAWQFDWNKPWLGAGSTLNGDVFSIMLWGGLVRSTEMTIEALELILCHEYGHALGGAPLQSDQWSSTEGQSDWWAARACLPKLYQTRGLSTIASADRIRKAGLDFTLWAHQHTEPMNETPSVSRHAPALQPHEPTLRSYPSLQCRLDTYVIAADCIANQTANCRRPACWFR